MKKEINNVIDSDSTTYKGHKNLSPTFVAMMKKSDLEFEAWFKELRSPNRKPQTEEQFREVKQRFYRRFHPEEIDELGNIKERGPQTRKQYEDIRRRFYEHFNKIRA